MENQKFAQQLEKCFAKTDVQYEHLICKEGRYSPTFNDTLKLESNPILLLLSDNYLKSQAAMSEALATFTQLFEQKKLTVLLIDGVDKIGKNAPTEFDRIGQLIKYMNFWQDKYLGLRQKGRKLGEISDELEIETKEVREISTNVGELLRYLRDQSIAKIDPIIADDFKSFKAFYKISGEVETSFLTSNVKVHAAPQPVSSPSEKQQIATPPVTETPSTNTETPLEEIVTPQAKADSFPVSEEELDIPPIELSAIPGVSMLNEKAKLQRNTEVELEADVKLEVATNGETTSKEKLETTEEKIIEEPVVAASNSKKFSIPTFLDDFKQAPEKKIPVSNIDDSLTSIEVLIKDGSFKSAKTQLDLLSEKHSRDARIWKNLGSIAEQQNDYILASTHYSRALELDPTLLNLDYKVGLINSNYYPDQMDKSMQYFNNAIDKNPTHAEAYYQLGIIQNEGKGLVDESIPTFKKVLELSPKHKFANYDLALIFYNKGDKESALDFYARAFKNNPELQTPENDQAFGYMPYDGDEDEVNTIEKEVEKPVEIPVIKKSSIDKTVLITGATSGIGKATAIAFAEAGYRIVLTGRRKERLEEFSKQLQSTNLNVKYLSFDVRDIKAAEEALNSLTAPFSDIDILINNAGLASGFDPIQTGSLKDWDRMIDTNIKGILFMVRLVSPLMVERKSGHIINLCSTAGHEVYPKGNVYCATKHAVDALTKGMRLDLHSHGIRVSQVSPAHVEETEFAQVRFHGDTEKAKIYEEFNPLKSSDVAQSILFIASQPPHVNIQDILLMGTQQASSTVVDRSGRKYD